MHTFRSFIGNLVPLILTVILGILLAIAVPHIEVWVEHQDVVAQTAAGR